VTLRRFPLGLIVLLGILVGHGFSLRGGFHYDDENVIVLNRANLEDPGTVLRMFQDPSVFCGIPGNPLFRPVAHATHVLDAHLGTFWRKVQATCYLLIPDWLWKKTVNVPRGIDPLPFHVTNLLLHAACALVLYHLLRRVLRVLVPGEPFGPERPPAADVAALFGALWFGLEPVNAEVVNYVSARSESMAALFFLLSLMAHHAAWEEGVGRGRRALLVVGSVLAALLSFGSKETGILLPALAGALELWARPKCESPVEVICRAIGRAIPLVVGVCVYWSLRMLAMPSSQIESRIGTWAAVLVAILVAVRVALLVPRVTSMAREGLKVLGSMRPSAWSSITFLVVVIAMLGLGLTASGDAGLDPLVGGGRTMAAHLLTQSRVFWNYALLLLWPVDLAPDHGVRVSAALDGTTVLALLGIAGILALVVRSFLRGDRVLPLVAAWTALAAAPSVLVPLNVVMNEHRLYLPATGLALGVGLGMLALLEAGVRRGKEVLVGLALMAVFVSFLLVDRDRARTWGNPFDLWERAVETSPTSWRNHLHLGVESFRGAQADFDRLDGLADRKSTEAGILDLRGRAGIDRALAEFTEAQRLYPGAFESRLNLGYLHLYRGQILNREADPDGPASHPEEYRQAIRWFEEAEKASPGSFRALYNRASAMARAGMVPEATAEFERLAKDPSRTTMYAWPLGDLYRRAGRTEEALAQFDLIERLSPEDAGTLCLKRAEVLTAARRFVEADAELQRAAKVLGMENPGPPLYKARLLVAEGKPEMLPLAKALWQAALERGHRPGPKDRALIAAIGR